MGRFIAAIVALIVLLAGIVVLAPNLIPADAYRGRIEAAATKALGRQVTLGEDLSFKIFPAPAFSVNDLVIANAPGFDGAHLARVDRADIGVKLGPLLSKRVEISRFVLTRPDLILTKAADGSVNWNLAASQATDAATGPGDANGAAVNDVSLGDVQFIDGRAVYTDVAAKKTYTLDSIDATAQLDSLSEPLEVKGEMNFQGAPSRVDLVLTSLADILAKKDSNVKLDAAIGGSKIGADLTLAGGDTLAYTGPVSIDAPDLPALAKLFDVRLEEAPGFDNLSVSGQATGAPTSISLSGAKIVFDKIAADGDIKLDWAGVRPRATGALSTGALDLRPYMPPPATSDQGFPAWSTAKMDFTSLRNIDADFDVSAESVFLNELEAGASRMNLKIANARMTASIPQLGFYGGGGSGSLIVDATKDIPSIIGKFSMASVEAQPFTMDLMKLDKLLGIGGFNLEFNAAGNSQAAIMNSLDGKGGFDLNNGAIKGVNIAKLASAVAKIYEGGITNPTALTSAVAEARRPDETTDFSKFLSSFTITDGQVAAPTIQLEGPYLTMNGVGGVNLPAQTLDIRLLPTASTAIDNKSGRMVSIPVRIGGTFSKPTIAIDVESLARGKAEETLKGVLDRALKPKSGATEGETDDSPASLIKGVLGGSKATPPAEPAGDSPTKASTTEPAPADATEALVNDGLNALFGRKKAPPAEAEPKTGDDN